MTTKCNVTRSGFDLYKKRIACLILSCASVGLVTGCASQRISNALERYDIPPQKAQCIGDRLADRLTFAQLQSLNRAAKAYRTADLSNGALAISDLMTMALELRNPQISLEIASAAIRCSAR